MIKFCCSLIQFPWANFWNSARSRPRVGAIIDIFDSVVAQPSVAQASPQPSILAISHLAIEQQAEPFSMIEFSAT